MSSAETETQVEPETNPADAAVKRIRGRTMDMLAEAALHVQRIEDAAQKLGLTPDLVEGVGNFLYEAVISRLELASKIVERSQLIAGRLLRLAPPKSGSQELLKLDAAVGAAAAHQSFVVSNQSRRPVNLAVAVESGIPAHLITCRPGKDRLSEGKETSVEVSVKTKDMKAGVYTGTVRVWFSFPGADRRERSAHDFELWVRA